MAFHQSSPRPVLILAGGLGTRLRSVESQRPKPMTPIYGKPFLYWLMRHLSELGFKDVILSIGYKAEQIKDYPWQSEFPELRFQFAIEDSSLGTGGATLKVLQENSQLEEFWVANGDTLLATPLPAIEMNSFEACYLGLREGLIYDATPNLQVQGEKVISEGSGGSIFDGGLTLVTRRALNRFSGKAPCSLHQVLTPAMQKGMVTYKLVEAPCYDIGTPQRLERFKEFVVKHFNLPEHKDL